MEDVFDKEYILKCCEGLYNEAFEANASSKIMIQMLNHQKDGYHGMDCSPVFYGTTYKALYRACIMDLARLFDMDSDSISFQRVMNCCRKHANHFPETITLVYKCSDGTYDEEEKSIIVTLSEEDINCIKQKSKLYQKICGHFELLKELKIKEDTPFEMAMTTGEYFIICQNRLKRYKDIIIKVKNLRNKRFAHNDKGIMFDIDSLMKANNISLSEMITLTDLVLDFVITVISLLKGEQLAKEYYNIDDLENTFNYVRLGKQIRQRKNI